MYDGKSLLAHLLMEPVFSSFCEHDAARLTRIVTAVRDAILGGRRKSFAPDRLRPSILMKFAPDIGADDILLHLNDGFVCRINVKLGPQHRKLGSQQVKHRHAITLSDWNASKRDMFDELRLVHPPVSCYLLVLVDKAVLILVAFEHSSSA
jgi:hypothetical protein